MHPRRRRGRFAAALLPPPLLVLVAVLAGCGGSDDSRPDVATVDGGPTAPGRPSARASADPFAYVGCMRENGVPLPDPKVADDGTVLLNAERGITDGAVYDRAHERCKNLFPTGVDGPAQDPADIDRALRFAACMRDQGIDFPDPDPASPDTLRVDPRGDSARVEAAARVCDPDGADGNGPRT
jgi:hypothetical protein